MRPFHPDHFNEHGGDGTALCVLTAAGPRLVSAVKLVSSSQALDGYLSGVEEPPAEPFASN